MNATELRLQTNTSIPAPLDTWNTKEVASQPATVHTGKRGDGDRVKARLRTIWLSGWLADWFIITHASQHTTDRISTYCKSLGSYRTVSVRCKLSSPSPLNTTPPLPPHSYRQRTSVCVRGVRVEWGGRGGRETASTVQVGYGVCVCGRLVLLL